MPMSYTTIHKFAFSLRFLRRNIKLLRTGFEVEQGGCHDVIIMQSNFDLHCARHTAGLRAFPSCR